MMQTSPVQQSALPVHGHPADWQPNIQFGPVEELTALVVLAAGGSHVPPAHVVPSQHSLVATHGWPACAQSKMQACAFMPHWSLQH
jgi:hypothetical protein